MPVENFGRQLSCWKEGGRKACKNDITFNEMEADMHNLVPVDEWERIKNKRVFKLQGNKNSFID